MKKLFYILIGMFGGISFAGAQNIKISDRYLPNEPCIMLDPKRPNVMVAGSNTYNYYVSTDTGRTWREDTLSSSYGVWGDPVIVSDTAGSFYFFHLSNPPKGSGNWIDRIVCQKTTDQGKIWSDGTYTGLNGTKAQDKEWGTVDRRNNNLYLVWTQFDKYDSKDPGDSSIILFSRSLDAGETWSQPMRISRNAGICLDDDKAVGGAMPVVGPNGEIYVSWAGPDGLVFNRSLDQGKTWLPAEIKISPLPGGWNYHIPGHMRANGFPVIACDTSDGPNRGTIYVNWSDQRNGLLNTDIWLSKSTDGGDTWSTPVKVNNDNTDRHQYFTWMTIDQTTGYLYFVFYDRRNSKDYSTDVFIAASQDGGKTFINRRISESPFKPTSFVFFGDYTNIVAHDGIIRPIWTRLENSQLSIWTDITTLEDIIAGTPDIRLSQGGDLSFSNYPNPATTEVFVGFKLRSASYVSLTLYNLQGQVMSRILETQLRMQGKHVEKIDIGDLGIKAGTYVLRLEAEDAAKTLKIVVID